MSFVLFCWLIALVAAQPCVFRCRSGRAATAWPAAQSHRPQLHGCLVLSSTVRAPALQALLERHGLAFAHCCKRHDECYGACGSVKGDCDRALVGCVVDVCRSTSDSALVEQCQPLLNRFFKDAVAQRAVAKGTALFSCKAFVFAQEGACDCGVDEDNFASRSEL